MKTILHSIILLSLFFTHLFAAEINIPTNIDSIILAKMDQYHFPGLQACIVKNDSIIWKGVYGYADISSNKLVTDSTLFYLASLSKPVTGTAIMQLWEEGLFGLDDDINNYLPFSVRNPSYPNNSITFRMLLTHTSGIVDNWSVLDPLVTWGMDYPDSLGSFINNYLTPGGNHYTSNNWSVYAPGSKYLYSNVGITIIGLLVEILADTSFENYCQDSIFLPLGMNETSWFLANLNPNHIATPYIYSGVNYTPNQHWGEPIFPGIQLRTSATQLSNFLSMFIQMGKFQNTIMLDSSTVALMTTVQNPILDPYMAITWPVFNWNLPNVGNRFLCGYMGARKFGANTCFGYVMETGENIGCTVLANREYSDQFGNFGIVDIFSELLAYGLLITGFEKNETDLPLEYTLKQNYPNPFNPLTTIEFSLPKSGDVELKVFNLLGQEVSTLVSKKLNQGKHTYTFDGKNLASGIYYYQLVAGDYREVKKMILLR